MKKIKDRKNALRKSVMPVDMGKLETRHLQNIREQEALERIRQEERAMQKKQLYDAKKRYGLLIRETKKPKVSEAKKRELELLVASMQNKHGRSLSTS